MQTIYLDISNKGVVHTIHAKQGDVGRKFGVVLTDSGLPYIPTSGSAFSVWYSGASGEGNYTDIGEKSAFSVNENEVTVEMIAQMLSNEGEGILSLVLNDNGGNQIGLWSIRYVCESVPGANSEEAKEYYSAFSESVKKLSDTDAILRSKLSVDGTNTMKANLPMGNHRVTDLSAPVADGDAVNLAYTKKVGNPRNLLDNSDFSNPVNQRGSGDTTNAFGYPVDRWQYSYDDDIPIGSSGYDASRKYVYLVNNASGGGNVMLFQKIPAENLRAGKYTVAFHQLGSNLAFSMLAYANGEIVKSETVTPTDGVSLMSFELAQVQTELTIYIYAAPGQTIVMDWAALYEGEYTVDTIPEYHPNGYGAELAECQRYLQRFRTTDLRKTYCEDFRPTMRMTEQGVVSTFEQAVDGVTYYFASAEL